MRLIFKLVAFAALLLVVAACSDDVRIKVSAVIGQVESPVFSPAGGNYSTAQSVSVSSPTPGAVIRYTLDDSEPGTGSPVYSSPLAVSSTTTIKARAFREGLTDSPVAAAVYTITLEVVATPTFTPAEGDYPVAQLVTLATATGGADIRYTLDGTDPSETAGQLYSAPFTLDDDAVVKAIAFKSGMANSPVATATYTITPLEPVATPTFSPGAGNYAVAQMLTLATDTIGAQIRYTFDGSDPSETLGTLYETPIPITEATFVKAIAFKVGMANSPVVSAIYTITPIPVVADPVFDPPGGDYGVTQQVTITTPTNGADIRYTLDGSTPTNTHGTYYTGPITVTGDTIIKAIAYMCGSQSSSVVTETYTITPLVPVETPSFSPVGGSYVGSQILTLSTATSGAAIRYTVDGTDPTETTGTQYNAPITIADNTVVKAIAYKVGMAKSPLASATYTITPSEVVATPAFSPAGGTYRGAQLVTLSTVTSGAAMRYTIDGTDPTETAGIVYTSPFSISADSLVKAIAYKGGIISSPVASAAYTITPTDYVAPTLTPGPGKYSTVTYVGLSTPTAGAVIYYTTDGSTPTAGSTVYTLPVQVKVSGTIRAIAMYDGVQPSDITTGFYEIDFGAQRFNDNGDGTITDNITGHMWQQQDDGVARLWGESVAYCENLTLGGHDDWRLPNIKESLAIVDYSRKDYALDLNYFTSPQRSAYWSTTPHAGYRNYWWRVNFVSGAAFASLDANFFARCVRR